VHLQDWARLQLQLLVPLWAHLGGALALVGPEKIDIRTECRRQWQIVLVWADCDMSGRAKPLQARHGVSAFRAARRF
jgi:hypothetical protein